MKRNDWTAVVLFLQKMIVYYYLIEAKQWEAVWIVGSALILTILYFGLSACRFRGHRLLFLGTYSCLSGLMFADTLYYQYYNQTLSVKQIWLVENMASVTESLLAIMRPEGFLLLLDIPVIYWVFRMRERQHIGTERRVFGRGMAGITVAAIFLLAVNPGDRVFAEQVGSVGFFTGHVRDGYRTAMEGRDDTVLSEEEIQAELEELAQESRGENYRGIAARRNLILVQVEALQSMMLQAEYDGQELMPHLNRLLEEDTLYFDRYYTSIGKGNTVDAEFATLNSLYPVIDRECYDLYRTNTYRGLPWMLREQGYQAFAMHGYLGDYWGREQAYPYQGFQDFYSLEDLDASEQIGLGISDISFYKQAVEVMREQEEPFFAFLVTLTNHHPYELPEELQQIRLGEELEDSKFGDYLQTVRYTDEAIGVLISELQAAGLYENSVIVFYGDHHGPNKKMDGNAEYVGRWLGKEYDYDEMLRVPLVIHIPGSGVHTTISTVGGQVDFLPTMAGLMGLDLENPCVLGRDLCNAEEGFAAFTAYLLEGSFVKEGVMFEVSRTGLFEGSRAWDTETGEELAIEPFYEDYQRALQLKAVSREILEQDLMGK